MQGYIGGSTWTGCPSSMRWWMPPSIRRSPTLYHKDPRRARSATASQSPTKTGAAALIEEVNGLMREAVGGMRLVR
ncbi:MAG: hypothetical protein U5L11_12135 [Arhodomonas sp.]|nr:hypothetical protein [Arhodomonas sp.]